MATRIRVPLNRFANAVSDELKRYEFFVDGATIKAVKQTAKQVEWETKVNSPVKTGKYKKSWGQKVTKDDWLRYEITVHNKKRYQLTHLLEFGHDGPVKARPYPHITKDSEAQQLFNIILGNILKNG